MLHAEHTRRAEALKGASAVVDVSNSPSFEEKASLDFFTTATGNLLRYEQAAGVQHHVALSVVGLGVWHKEGRRTGKRRFAGTFERSLYRKS
jgi:hypothetical protein